MRMKRFDRSQRGTALVEFLSDSRVESERVVVVSPELVVSTPTMPPLPTDRPERM